MKGPIRSLHGPFAGFESEPMLPEFRDLGLELRFRVFWVFGFVDLWIYGFMGSWVAGLVMGLGARG